MVSVWSIIPGIIAAFLVLLINKWWDPIAQRFGYPFDVPRRVRDLVRGIEELLELRSDLLSFDPHPSSEHCRGWLRRVQASQVEAQEIKRRSDALLRQSETGQANDEQDEANDVNRWLGVLCWLGKRLEYYCELCSVGRLAALELENVMKLVSDGREFLKEASAAPHAIRNIRPPTGEAVGASHQLAQSTIRKAVETWGTGIWAMEPNLIKALQFVRDDNNEAPGVLGIWGMGGVGKTTLLKLVRDSGVPSFDHVIFVKVGKQCKVDSVQKDIAVAIRLQLPDSTSRATTISNYLQSKNFLLLLDDLWEHLDLEEVGIPMPLGARGRQLRKIILSTRRELVCGKMGCAENNIRIGCLDEEDAWSLFKDKVGSSIIGANHPIPASLARKVAAKCGGLPLALCVIGRAMSTKKNRKLWNDAVHKLAKSRVHNNLVSEEDMFGCLRYSYDNLHNDDERNCLLVCSLWPQGKYIPRKQLIQWCMGLGFSEVSDGFEGGESLIANLLDASLLEKRGGMHVRMHDVIRDMALWIVNRNSMEQETCLPHSSSSPTLGGDRWSVLKRAWIEEANDRPWPSEDCWPKLEMLGMRFTESSSLQTIRHFKKLTFLELGLINHIEEFPREICELVNLEYLNILQGGMHTLPMELGNLSNLKHLYLRQAWQLRTIPRGLISRLRKLEVLDLFSDCSDGPFSPKSGGDFSHLLRELAGPEMENLQILGICLETVTDDIIALEKLKRVRVQSLCLNVSKPLSSEYEQHHRRIELKPLSNLDSLTELAISSSDCLKEIVAAWDPTPDKDELLPNLDHLCLEHLNALEKVTWRNTGKDLREVYIVKCGGIKHATWVLQLECLSHLDIINCPKFERLIDIEELSTEGNTTPSVIFPQLTHLTLSDLPKLSAFCELPCEFTELAMICVTSCSKLTTILFHPWPLDRKKHNIWIICEQDWWDRLECTPNMMKSYFDPKIIRV